MIIAYLAVRTPKPLSVRSTDRFRPADHFAPESEIATIFEGDDAVD
jgi:hypothetical protein